MAAGETAGGGIAPNDEGNSLAAAVAMMAPFLSNVYPHSDNAAAVNRLNSQPLPVHSFSRWPLSLAGRDHAIITGRGDRCHRHHRHMTALIKWQTFRVGRPVGRSVGRLVARSLND